MLSLSKRILKYSRRFYLHHHLTVSSTIDHTHGGWISAYNNSVCTLKGVVRNTQSSISSFQVTISLSLNTLFFEKELHLCACCPRTTALGSSVHTGRNTMAPLQRFTPYRLPLAWVYPVKGLPGHVSKASFLSSRAFLWYSLCPITTSPSIAMYQKLSLGLARL